MSAPKLKGYLPIRIGLPPSAACKFLTSRSNTDRTDTFCFVKEHRTGASGKSSTLFVVNCPFVPNVRTSLLLKSTFARYGDVERVTVVRDPRDVAAPSALAAAGKDDDHEGDDATAPAGASSKTTSQPPSSDAAAKLFDDQVEVFSDPHRINFVDSNDEGSFGHVVFASSKDLRLALKALGKLMASGPSEKDGLPPAVTLGALEVQDLVEASNKLLKKEEAAKYGVPMHGPPRQDDSDSESDGQDDDPGNRKRKKRRVKTGIHALAERQRTLYVKRRFLMEACNAIMEQYEEAEEEAAARARAAAQMPDDDGFVTVVSSKAPAVGADLEEDVIGGGDAGEEGRRKGSKRKRKKKEARGSSELKDFYRFQTKETRKKGLQELRERFEADLAKVKKLKEEKAYRAF